MPPLTVVRAADARPYDLQELIVSDTRFKLFIFAGNVSGDAAQKDRLDAFVAEATSPSGFLARYGRRRGEDSALSWDATFETFTILQDTKEDVEYTAVPSSLRPHWST